MKLFEKLEAIQKSDFNEWLRVRQIVEDELSDNQSMFCVCGKLATGLHESMCVRFRNKVNTETVKRLKHLIPKQERVVRTYHDEDCPRCGFPETIDVRNAVTMEIVRRECSKRCGWEKTF